MTRTTCAVVAAFAASLLAAAPASARDYGEAGTIELGGGLSIGNTTQDFDNGGKDTRTDITISPEVGYFVMDGLIVLGTLGLGMSSVDYEGDEKDESTDISVGAGAGYLLPVGIARIGPAARVRYIMDEFKSTSGGTTSTTDVTGMGFDIAGVAKLPVGSGGVITASLFYSMENLTAKSGGAEGDLDRTAIGTSVGFSIFF